MYVFDTCSWFVWVRSSDNTFPKANVINHAYFRCHLSYLNYALGTHWDGNQKVITVSS